MSAASERDRPSVSAFRQGAFRARLLDAYGPCSAFPPGRANRRYSRAYARPAFPRVDDIGRMLRSGGHSGLWMWLSDFSPETLTTIMEGKTSGDWRSSRVEAERGSAAGLDDSEAHGVCGALIFPDIYIFQINCHKNDSCAIGRIGPLALRIWQALPVPCPNERQFFPARWIIARRAPEWRKEGRRH
jgi:hypothetical protein